ncbi:hypothetical protein [Algoriphagus aquimarinus]|uniref:Uncharacterized protein n=1 Tax=Algoriphagus aquimarinus TaxID=237018 RepID=A0A1I1CH32_9BACT|nr:hypothetical protein [Algoriphagus aquimarinus]SFB59763.1 hypothetical protein SAMN04489723_1279 [Algoriphagus aquimarinus]
MLDIARSIAIENLYLLIFREELTNESVRNMAYLIWAIDNFRYKDADAEIRVGIEIPWQEDFQELVVRVSKEIFWIGMEAIHRTGAGSDSYDILKEVLKGIEIHFLTYSRN